MTKILFIALMAQFAACVTIPAKRNTFTPQNFSEMRSYLLNKQPNLDIFSQSGPFTHHMHKNFAIRVTTSDLIFTDLFLADHNQKAPLVIFIHGNGSWKEAHRFQAINVASWGMHALTLQMPNYKRWMKNGKLLAKLVNLLYRWPDLIDQRIDINKIILVGHSFGGSAVALAIGNGAPALGAILLDPAVVRKDIIKSLVKINIPVMLLGADQEVFQSRRRGYFFKHIPKRMAEVSIRGATHDDAQYPSRRALQYFGFDPFTSQDKQEKFKAAITATAFSLGANGNLNYAWKSFSADIKQGTFFNAKKK